MPRLVRLWWLWAILALVAGAVTTAAARGFPIVDLELAGTVERVDAVTHGVNVDTIRLAIAWDFLFIVLYALALAAGALWSRRQFVGRLGRAAGIIISAGGVVAGALDIVENLALLAYLNDWGTWSGWIPLARAVAIPKFALALAGVVYIAIGGVLFIVHRFSSRNSRMAGEGT